MVTVCASAGSLSVRLLQFMAVLQRYFKVPLTLSAPSRLLLCFTLRELHSLVIHGDYVIKFCHSEAISHRIQAWRMENWSGRSSESQNQAWPARICTAFLRCHKHFNGIPQTCDKYKVLTSQLM